MVPAVGCACIRCKNAGSGSMDTVARMLVSMTIFIVSLKILLSAKADPAPPKQSNKHRKHIVKACNHLNIA